MLVKEVAAREIRTRSRTKAFRVITGILVAAAVIGPIVSAVLPEGGDDLREVTVGLVDIDEDTQQQIVAFAEGALDVTLQDYSGIPRADLDQALSDGDIDVALEAGPTLVWDRETDFEIAGVLYTVLQQQDVLVKGRALGLGEGDIAELLTPAQFEERFADPTDESDSVATGVAFFGLMVAFILPQVFGQLTMLSVVEEKSTRVIEVLLGHLRPPHPADGKGVGSWRTGGGAAGNCRRGPDGRIAAYNHDRHTELGLAICAHHCRVDRRRGWRYITPSLRSWVRWYRDKRMRHR